MIANGMVLVVPGKVVPIDMEKMTIGAHWTTLLSIFGQSDQCLVIDDPLTDVMDRIHVGVDPDDEIGKYCITRLSSVVDEENSLDLPAVFTKTLAGFRARKAGDTTWLEDRITSVVDFANDAGLLATSEVEPVQNVAALFGFPLSVVESLRDHLGDYESVKDFSVLDWCESMFDWFSKDIAAFQTCIRHDNLTRLFGKSYEDMTHKQRAHHAIPRLRVLSHLWMTGEPLMTLEEEAQKKPIKDGDKCVAARRFALRCIPDLSYAFGLPAKLLEHQLLGDTVLMALPGVVENLARCVRKGFCNLELSALQQCLSNKALTRRQIYQQFEDIANDLEMSQPGDLYDTVLERVDLAVLLL
jgi:antiviral helicase SKI2